MKAEKIIYKNIAELKEYKRNPRQNDKAVDSVAQSIRRFGFKVPIVIDRDGVIVCGHTRMKASQKIGLEEVPCIIADDLTPEEVRAFRLADNKAAELADWDMELLEAELQDLADWEVPMEEFGFGVDMDEATQGPTAQDDNFEVEIEDEKPATVKRGQLWQLGRHFLLCGDSTKREDVEKLMQGNKADLVFTDPPYGMFLDTDYSAMNGSKKNIEFRQSKNVVGGKTYDKVIGDNNDFKPELIKTIFDNFGYCKEIFLWGADYFAELLENKNDGSWIVWDKRDNNEQFDKMFGSMFELCWSKNKHKREIARVRWCGVFGTEQEFDKKRHHPTQKPIKLVEWFLNRYSELQQNVVDLYGGSGSTLITCEQLARNCYTMELDEKYCDVIIKRWETLTGQKARLCE